MGGVWCVAARTRGRLAVAGDAARGLWWNNNSPPAATRSKRRRMIQLSENSPSPSSSIEILPTEPQTAAIDLDDDGDVSLHSFPPNVSLPPPGEDEDSRGSENSPTNRIVQQDVQKVSRNDLGNSIATRTRSSKFLAAERKAVDYTGFFEASNESSDIVDEETDELDEGGTEAADIRDLEEDSEDNASRARSYSKRKRDQMLEDDPLLQKLIEIKNRETLPLLFSFGDEEEEPAEKSESEKLMDELWDEFDLALHSINTDSFSSSENNEDEKEEQPEEEGRSHHSFPCKNGNHELVLDEQIGLRCRVCFFVQQEIKRVIPSMATECQQNRSFFRERNRRDIRHSLQTLPLAIDQEVNLKTASNVWDTIPGTKSTLFPHQQQAFEFLWKNLAGHLSLKKLSPFPSPPSSSLGGCIIAHKPGSGKTRLAITFIQSFLRLHPLSLAVVVVPKSMLRTWENEFHKWKVNVTVNILERSRDVPPGLHLRCGVLLVSFGIFSRLAEVADRPDCLLVLDECHTARNNRSRLWNALNRARTLNRVLLSGTLYQNSLDELRNTLRLARPNFDRQAGLKDNDELRELKEMMRPFVHVHGGSAATLPPLKDSLLILDPSPAQRHLLKAMEEEGGTASLRVHHRSSLAAVHPSLGGSASAMDAAQGVKTRFVAELVKRCQRLKEKILVFGQFLEPLELLGSQMEELFKWKKGKEVLRMDGELAAAQREEVMERFNEEGGRARVLLASTKACSEGISLIGASRVVLLDVVWNPAVEWQAISRAYRLGQRRAVYVYRLVAEEAGEWRKHLRQVEKHHMARLVMSLEDGGDGRGVTSAVDTEDEVLKEMMEDGELKCMFKKVICDPMESNASSDPSIF